MIRRSRSARTAVLLATALIAGGCERSPEPDAGDAAVRAALLSAVIPEEHLEGERVFNVHCVACHGERGTGTALGPPLVHIIYEPSHHADAAFFLAVERGVRAHHWGFGDMPPVPGLGRNEVEAVVGYIRWLQRQVGIF
jgi:mono/diheme cytochrome c family protein